ncbi:unnamed protein product [Fraxinus pennsylvanica]|uniref:UBC core domain-containing protein n=1 Tax=Fraxinus pennsylvanica TaxID=56036 RepID=A0AAD1ZE95_9LAMI|nr:unnamed protein product [Fraxinus pennsylvanica]
MSTPSRKRLIRDFKRLQQDSPAGISCAPQDNNIMLWNAVIFGPDDACCDGGLDGSLLAPSRNCSQTPLAEGYLRVFAYSASSTTRLGSCIPLNATSVLTIVKDIIKSVQFHTTVPNSLGQSMTKTMHIPPKTNKNPATCKEIPGNSASSSPSFPPLVEVEVLGSVEVRQFGKCVRVGALWLFRVTYFWVLLKISSSCNLAKPNAADKGSESIIATRKIGCSHSTVSGALFCSVENAARKFNQAKHALTASKKRRIQGLGCVWIVGLKSDGRIHRRSDFKVVVKSCATEGDWQKGKKYEVEKKVKMVDIGKEKALRKSVEAKNAVNSPRILRNKCIGKSSCLENLKSRDSVSLSAKRSGLGRNNGEGWNLDTCINVMENEILIGTSENDSCLQANKLKHGLITYKRDSKRKLWQVDVNDFVVSESKYSQQDDSRDELHLNGSKSGVN